MYENMEKMPVVRPLPLIIRKSAIIKRNTESLKVATLFREDVIYDTTDVYYLKGEYRRMTLVNRMNIVTKVSRTVAKYVTKSGSVLEKTSDGISKVIGQEQYKTLLTALCSIIDQELRIRGILALLTAVNTADLKIENSLKGNLKKESDKIEKKFNEAFTQTYESRLEQKPRGRRRIRKPAEPYVVKDPDINISAGTPNILNITNSVLTSDVNNKNLNLTNTTNSSNNCDTPAVHNSVSTWNNFGIVYASKTSISNSPIDNKDSKNSLNTINTSTVSPNNTVITSNTKSLQNPSFIQSPIDQVKEFESNVNTTNSSPQTANNEKSQLNTAVVKDNLSTNSHLIEENNDSKIATNILTDKSSSNIIKIASQVINFDSNVANISNETSPAIVNSNVSNANSDTISANASTASVNNTVSNEIDSDVNTSGNSPTDIPIHKSIDTQSLQDLGYLQDEFSNDSFGRFSTLSDAPSYTELVTNPSFLNNVVDQHTKIELTTHFKINIHGMDIVLPYKPEDVFHIATKENLEYLDQKCRLKVLEHQMRIDFKHCLTTLDEDGNLPIHMAVLNEDLELLKRQCYVLKLRQVSVDIRAKGVTPLELALHQPSPSSALLSACLLRAGASPCRAGAGHRTAMHVAAEREPDTLRAVVAACVDNARVIVEETEELWSEALASEKDENIVRFVMRHLCSQLDQQGYTPLMLASMLGNYENVRLLLEHSPTSVNDRMPTSGNTALYLAVAAAWNSSADRGNKSKIEDHFRKTIDTLLEYDADPNIDNHSGTNVNVLLTEFNSAELSMLIASRRTFVNIIKNNATESVKEYDNLMLVKDRQGNLEYKKLENDKKKNKRNTKKNKEDNNKPVIVQNILLKSPETDLSTSVSKCSGGKSVKKVDESIKVSKLQDIVITGKNSPVLGESKKLVVVPKERQSLKRKIAEDAETMKMARTDK